ncbi:hypothetical protein B0H67DRAFT_566079 [Lasiosphaeris hirsuta]|uniref:G domain-containing protein n=1 Tax=Lasiosphaeris hirsuta TaxID=260670 RepID=A0AA40BCR9_9PEZI|nr:hypothetical protein B0H67DRAFT_566079 [Lasiosphaeris hirsuta]
MTGAEIVILLIGPHGSGKTSFIKCVTGSTTDVAPTTRCRDYRANVDGNAFRLIDTPGLDDLPAGNLSILKDIVQTLEVLGSSKGPIDVNGAIFFHRITDGRFGGSARSNLDVFKQICGTKFAHQVVFVTSMWNKPSPLGQENYQRLSDELRQKYFSIGTGPGTAFPFGNKAEDAKKVLKYFGDRNKREMRELLLAQEVKRSGTSLSGVRRTSAGREIMQASNRGFCTLF